MIGKPQQRNVWLFVHAMIMALTPVVLLPISYFVFRETIGWRAVFRTVLAIAGVAILFLA